jgi:hypothetical protein
MSMKKAITGPQIAWHISSYSASGSKECVEAGPLTDGSVRFAVRDSQHRALATLTVPGTEWTAFLNGLHTGEF